MFVACTHSTENLDQAQQICFDSQVLPIIQTNCAISGCHSSEKGGERLVLDSYDNIAKEVSANSLSNSNLYQAITGTWGELMPPSPREPLTQEQREIIAVWIQQGAKHTTCK